MAQLSEQALAEMVEFYEAAAFSDVLRAAPASLGLVVEESDDGVAFFSSAHDTLLLNRAMGIGLRTTPSKDLIVSLIERYNASGVTNYGIQLSPAVTSPAVMDLLRGCDLHARDNWTKVYRNCDPEITSSTDLRIARASKSEAGIFAKLAREGFGRPESFEAIVSATVGAPGWIHYLAWDGDTPAGVAALRVQDDIGWLGIGAVLPPFRRRGGQGALMSQRINDANDLGCKWVITETGQDLPEKPNPSFHNMIRTGFQVAYHRPNYMPPKPG